MRLKQTEKHNKNTVTKIRVSFVIFVLLFVAVLVTVPLMLKSLYPSASDIVIKRAMAESLKKNANDLTKDDFAKITKLHISNKDISNIRLLKRFTNLDELYLTGINIRKSALPKWMSILEKIHLINQSDKDSIDLSPLEKLTNLKTLYISGKGIKNIEPIKNLSNLINLNISDTEISDIKSIKDLPNLEYLTLWHSQVTDLKQIKNFKKLRVLNLSESQTLDLKPLLELENLKMLSIFGNISFFQINPGNSSIMENGNIDFETIKKLKTLETLNLTNSVLSKEQQEDLQKANPNLKIGVGYVSN